MNASREGGAELEVRPVLEELGPVPSHLPNDTPFQLLSESREITLSWSVPSSPIHPIHPLLLIPETTFRLWHLSSSATIQVRRILIPFVIMMSWYRPPAPPCKSPSIAKPYETIHPMHCTGHHTCTSPLQTVTLEGRPPCLRHAGDRG